MCINRENLYLLCFLLKPSVVFSHFDSDFADRTLHISDESHHTSTTQSPCTRRLRELGSYMFVTYHRKNTDD